MTSKSPSSLNDIREAIEQHGFYSQQDPLLGEMIRKMEDDRTPFASAGGFRFCRATVLDNSHIRPVLDSFFPSDLALGLYRSLGASPGDYAFKKSRPEAAVESLVVLLWKEGSVIRLWNGLHHNTLPSISGENRLWRVPPIAIKNLKLPETLVSFDQGGYTILDTRSTVSVVNGYGIMLCFGEKEVVRKWNPMEIPWSQETEEVAEGMQGSDFWINMTYTKGKT